VAPGRAKVAVRPEAWQLGAPGGEGLAGMVAKCAYLGSHLELTLDTALGAIFVVTPDLGRRWQPGDSATLRLGERGVSVVAG